MCDCEHKHQEERRGVLRRIASGILGLFAVLIPGKSSEAAQVCGVKCISRPWDGGRCTKPKRPFHQFHKCSKGHTWP